MSPNEKQLRFFSIDNIIEVIGIDFLYIFFITVTKVKQITRKAIETKKQQG